MTRLDEPDADSVLVGLDPEQREVATSPRGPMAVLAGAGTGKTRAITHRIAYGVHSGTYDARHVLAVTFTARAAGEMRTRLRGLGVPAVQARTFHAAALRQLQFFWPQAVGGPPPEVVAHKAPAVAEAAGRLRLRLDRPQLRDLAAEIEWAKVGMLTPEAYVEVARAQERRPGGLDATATSRLMQTYHEVTSERHVIDFEDVLLLTVGMLAEHEHVAARVREQYRHFVVDEYQDVNRVQQQLLEQWVGDREDICVVGDAAQTIYSFTGASAEHLRTFAGRHPGARTVRLVRNYRSTPQVLGVANVVLKAAEGGAAQLQSQGADGPAPQLRTYPDDEAEARGVAEQIRELVQEGRAASEIAVLFRTHAQSETVETALAESGVPYLVRGGERFFSRAEVRQAILLLRGAARSDDGSVPLGDLARDVMAGAGWTPEPASTGGATRERWESLQALGRLADAMAANDPQVRLPGLVAELDRRAGDQHAPTVEGVTLASLHAAKGLEWETVFLVGCSDGLLPITLAATPERVEEERRLLYVGLTRARTDLQLSWARDRAVGGRAGRTVSRFLAPAVELLGAPEAARPARGRRRSSSARGSVAPRTCRTCGGLLGSASERKVGRCSSCPPTYEPATFEALRSWRSQVAQEASVPAFVVFTDATLTAIAEREPHDQGALATISGVGPRKLELYGEQVLALLAVQREA